MLTGNAVGILSFFALQMLIFIAVGLQIRPSGNSERSNLLGDRLLRCRPGEDAALEVHDLVALGTQLPAGIG